MDWLSFIILGLVAGAVSGLVGIGGGLVVVPALVMFFGFSQKMAQGTTLAMLIPPIGILAAYTYYKHGYVNIYAAGFIIIGFVIGSVIGAHYISSFSNATVVRIFGVFLLLVALRMLITAKA